MNIPNYTVLTDKSVLDIPYEDESQYSEACIGFFENQVKKIEENGFDYHNKVYEVHFFNSVFRDESIEDCEIDDAIQCLAIKDGVDLVRFDNGKIGFIAYYGIHKDGFEILMEGEYYEE